MRTAADRILGPWFAVCLWAALAGYATGYTSEQELRGCMVIVAAYWYGLPALAWLVALALDGWSRWVAFRALGLAWSPGKGVHVAGKPPTGRK